MRQSLFGHLLVVVSIYGITVTWFDRPRVFPEEIPRTTISHYQLSEYLPEIHPQSKRAAVPVRRLAQKADPELASQEIVSLHENHSSLRQTIVQPSPNLLHQDVAVPNMVVSSPLPGAPVAARRSVQALEFNAPQIVQPPQHTIDRSVSRLTFPVSPQPEVVPPPEQTTARANRLPVPMTAPDVVPPAPDTVARHAAPVIPLSGPVVVPPSQDAVARDVLRLSIPVQGPQIAAPAEKIASHSTLAAHLPVPRPQVVPPSEAAGRRNLAVITMPAQEEAIVPPPQSTASRNLSAIGVAPQPQAAVPPSPPIAAGTGPAQEKAIGQLLALNAQPIAPMGPISIPEGNRSGEFAAGPEGRRGATARPEVKAGVPSAATQNSALGSSPSIFVSAPPNKIIASNVVATAVPLPRPAPASLDLPSSDHIDAQVFGSRKHYSMRLSMPNLSSAMGSWIIRFAELHAVTNTHEDLSAPEPIRKVDPAYPASMVADRVEGVVVLYAIIRSDGSVAEVRVLEGFDQRLDENARAALEQWRFRPGTKNGVPVDIEAVVRVPFRVQKRQF
jgi:TonB family protein